MATKSLTFDIYGRDKSASKTMKGIGKEADGLGKKFSGIAKGIGVAAGIGLVALTGAAVSFATESVKAFAEAEEQQKKLEDAYARFPALADTNIEAIRKMNSALMKKTRFDDDAIAVGQAQLAQYGLTGEQLMAITPLLLDYAARTGKDVVGASEDLGKALLGQGRALKNIGIDFKDTGTLAGNLGQLMDGLGSQVSGFAEKDAATASGQLEILQNRFGEVQEKIGEALMPALGKLMDFFDTDVMPGLETFATWLADEGIPAIQDFGAWLGGNKDVLGPAAIAVGGLTAAVWLLNAAMAANPYVLVVAGIIAVATTMFLFKTQIDEFIQANPWVLVFAPLLGLAVTVPLLINTIARHWDTFVIGVGQATATLRGIWNGLVGFLAGIAVAIVGTFARMASGVSTKVGEVVGFVRSIPSRIAGIFASSGVWLFSAGQSIIQGFIDGIGSMVGAVGAAVGNVMDFVAGFFPHSPAKRGPFSGAGWRRVLDGGVALGEQFTTGFNAVTGGVRMGSLAGAMGAPATRAVGGSSITSVGAPAVYVQNPWTGEYMEARLAGTAAQAVSGYDKSSSRTQRQGFRP